jgi:hypothetical protein
MDYIMWLLIEIFIYLAIGYIFIYLTGAYEDGFWEEFKIMFLWPILVIILGICCIVFTFIGRSSIKSKKYDY